MTLFRTMRGVASGPFSGRIRERRMSVLWGLLALAGLLGGANVAIRRGLAAPRVIETGNPQGVPWRARHGDNHPRADGQRPSR